jgi:serine/threonine-protein kinase
MKSPRPEVSGEPPYSASDAAEFRTYLDRLVASGVFGGSARKSQLLRYLAERALSGRESEITEYAIGLDVFEKPPSFDPRIDSAVRSEISRLRQRLKEHYQLEGRSDPVVIEFPQRSYVPVFSFAKVDAPKPRSPWPLAIAAAVLVLAGVAAFILWRARADKSSVGSIAVLPFANLSADPRNEYIADGLTEELTNELAQFRDLRVVARTSAFQFKGKAVDVREIGRRLNVEAILEGSFDRQDDKIRITAQLNRTSNGYHLWSKAFEAQSPDMMAVQDEMARAIAQAIRGIGAAPAPVAVATTNNPEAHDLFLQASYQFSLRTVDAIRKGRELLRSAVEKDPSYGTAYRGIARAEIALVHLTAEPPREGLDAARKALEKALALNPHDAEALGELGDLKYVWDWDWPAAEADFRAAVEQGAQATTHSYYGWGLATRGRFDEAHRELRAAEDLDPLNTGPKFNEGMAFAMQRRYREAKQLFQDMVDSKTGPLEGHLMVGLVGIYEHDCGKASEEFDAAAKQYSAPLTKFGLALAAACTGRIDDSRSLLKEAASGKGFVSPYQLALGYAYIKDDQKAFQALEESAEAREGQILYIRYEPLFDSIRADPRFVDLERRVGLDR